MCFNYQTSLFTFFIGTLFSILLILKGSNKFLTDNKIFGVFLIFISMIQLMDFLFWIDLHNTLGINKVVTIIGPILNICQPIILYLIKYYYHRPNLFRIEHFIIFMLNVIYLIYFITGYVSFLQNESLITGVDNNHLKWPWIKYSTPVFYLILLAVNIFYLSDFKYSLIFFVISYLFLYISVIKFSYNIGELWCFFGSFIPFILYFVSFHI